MPCVALPAEGVVRNEKYLAAEWENLLSPSSRRAWIEIVSAGDDDWFSQVALLAEGVDRNFPIGCFPHSFVLSPSSRRAWIEISLNFANL